MHLVHHNTKYNSFSEATSHSDGLAVLGVMLDIPNDESTPDHAAFGAIINQLGKIAEAGEETKLSNPLRLMDLLPNSVDSFYRYGGSLTTPKFAEIVIWTVFDHPIVVSQEAVSVNLHLSNSSICVQCINKYILLFYRLKNWGHF